MRTLFKGTSYTHSYDFRYDSNPISQLVSGKEGWATLSENKKKTSTSERFFQVCSCFFFNFPRPIPNEQCHNITYIYIYIIPKQGGIPPPSSPHLHHLRELCVGVDEEHVHHVNGANTLGRRSKDRGFCGVLQIGSFRCGRRASRSSLRR